MVSQNILRYKNCKNVYPCIHFYEHMSVYCVLNHFDTVLILHAFNMLRYDANTYFVHYMFGNHQQVHAHP